MSRHLAQQLADSFATALAEEREAGRQEERDRLQRLAPLTTPEIGRLMRDHTDAAGELQERMGSERLEAAEALAQLARSLERAVPLHQLEQDKAYLRARALIVRLLGAAALDPEPQPAPRAAANGVH